MSERLAYQLPEDFARDLTDRNRFPEDFLTTDAADLASYGGDRTAKQFPPNPAAIARPRSEEEVLELVRACNDHLVSIVPRGGGTGLSGGAAAMSGELVVSMERMRTIYPVDELGMTLRAQPGATLKAVQDAANDAGFLYPVDFAAAGSAQIGGTIATNAGGVHVVRYGMTRDQVLGLRVVTGDGRLHNIGGPLVKNNTGYDLRQLFIGSEGTLGIITEATLQLTTRSRDTLVALLALPNLQSVLEVLKSVRKAGFDLMAYEFFTDACVKRVQRHRKQAGRDANLGYEAPFHALMELVDPDMDRLGELQNEFERKGLIERDIDIAETGEGKRRSWAWREEISSSLAATGVPHKYDISVPIRNLDDFCTRLEFTLALKYPDWEICVFGHVGDGNLHVNVMKPDAMEPNEFFDRTHNVDETMFGLVQEFGGSISAEHGIGLLKIDGLNFTRSAAEIDYMRAIKGAFDPNNILNPGKIFATRT